MVKTKIEYNTNFQVISKNFTFIVFKKTPSKITILNSFYNRFFDIKVFGKIEGNRQALLASLYTLKCIDRLGIDYYINIVQI